MRLLNWGQDEEEGEPSGDEDRSDLTLWGKTKQSVQYKGIVFLFVETKVDENEHENACTYCLLCCMMYVLCMNINIYIYILCLCMQMRTETTQ